MKVCVLTTTPPERGLGDRPEVEVRPLPKPGHPRRALVDAFGRGFDAIILADVPVHASELDATVDALLEADAVAWRDPAPRWLPPGARPALARVGPPPAMDAVAVAVRRYALEAVAPAPRRSNPRAAIAELACAVARVGLEVRYLQGLASADWTLGARARVVAGVLSGLRRNR